MKGKIIIQRENGVILGWPRKEYYARHILIPDANNLLVTPHNNQLNIQTGFKGKYKTIRKINVPDELVKKIKKIEELREKFEALVKE